MSPTQSVSSIRLPSIVLARAAGISKAHRTLVTIALNKQLSPVLPPPEDTIKLTLNLHIDMIAKIKTIADHYHMSFSGAFAALANAGLQHVIGKESADDAVKGKIQGKVESHLLLNDTDEVRPQQKEFWIKIATGLAMNKAVMVEGTTGVGKGRAIMSAAIMCAKSGKYPVIIAAPTIKILTQLYQQEYLNNESAKKAAKKLTIAFLPGKQEFINETQLKEYLTSHPCPAVQEWVDAGGPNREATALSIAANQAGIKLSWLTVDLRAIAGDELRADDFTVSDNDKKNKDLQIEGAMQLLELIEFARKADIVLCTHAMLARMSISAWGILPAMTAQDHDTKKLINTPVIIIDEAHLFEEAMSAAASHELSMFSIRLRLERFRDEMGISGGSVIDAIKIVRNLTNYICDINEEDKTMTLRAGRRAGREDNYNEIINGNIAKYLHDLSKIMAKRGAIKKMKGIADDLKTINEIIKGLETGENRVQVSYSPQRRFPSIIAGRASVAPELSRVWSIATGGVGLVSATLWLPDWEKNDRINYMRDILHLPLDRIDAPASVEWNEVYEAPTLYSPSREIAVDLMPPSDNSTAKLVTWCANQAKVIAKHNKSCKGGTLVLCTSYAQMRTLSKALVDHGIDKDRIVENSGRLVDDQKEYTRLYHNRQRPLWLALGPAWTGIDLIERALMTGLAVDARRDNLLTDLIITRIPLGLNHTLSMDTRIAYNYMSIAYDALLRLKQGLGRLIRRAGLLNRRILILDGRMSCDPRYNNKFVQKIVVGAHTLLDKYHKNYLIGP